MEKLIDNTELEVLMTILENMEDEELAVKLLAELNAATKSLGTLVLDLDRSLKHDEWKKSCDNARSRVEKVVADIKNQAK